MATRSNLQDDNRRVRGYAGPLVGLCGAVVCGFLGGMTGGLIGCAPPVDVSSLEPIDGYEQWYRVDASGRVPGHGDGYRIIYANDRARTFAHEGAYLPGTVIVKEIRDGDDENGALSYLGVMRKLTVNDAPEGVTLDGVTLSGTGWLFTILDELGAEESQSFVCWDGCHVQAPVDGAWLDYGM